MGTQSSMWRFLSLGVILPLVAMSLFPSCDEGSDSKVSSELFLAAIPSRQFTSAAGPTGFRVLLDRIDILGPIDPDRFPSEVAQLQSALFVMGDLERASAPTELLVYDQQSRSVMTINTCQDPDICINRPPGFRPVKLNYSAQGLSTEQNRPQVGISVDVPPVRLANGWILAFDTNTRNIVGFKKQPPVEVVDDNGQLQSLPYRSTTQKANANFGRGDGVLLSVVISGDALANAVGANTLTRMHPIGDNKVMLFFSTVPDIHLLELRDEATFVDFDLANQSQTGLDIISVQLLKGQVQFFPANPLDPASPLSAPFVRASRIASLVGAPVIDVDEFQPATIPEDGSALIFEQETSNFVRIVEVPSGGASFIAVRRDVLQNALRATAGVSLAGAELDMGGTFLHPNRPEICIMEENTNNIIAYDYNADILNNVRVAYPSTEVQTPRDISEAQGGVTAVEPSLAFADSSVRDNWLAFEFGKDEILTINLTSPAIGVSAKRRDIIAVTFDSLASVPRLIPLDENNVRFLDTQSVSLIQMKLQYGAFPIRIED